MRANWAAALLIVCVAAALVPWMAPPAQSVPVGSFPGWPTHFEGKPLRVLPLGPLEQRFAADFPGRIGRFSDGEREIVIRWVSGQTRKLHPSSDCFRGVGYSITPQPIVIEPDGTRWSRFEAVRGNEQLEVRERLYDASGNQWSDVSAWYWAATMGKSSGPWWAITIASSRPAPQNRATWTISPIRSSASLQGSPSHERRR
jgi:hypothetical protein